MATKGDGRPEQRIYSAAEIDACLRFVKLSSSEVQWWPCLVFSNMLELQHITEHLQLWTTMTQRRELTMLYMQHLPGSATCRVALLMGQPPAPNSFLKFDIPAERGDDAFILEPFYDNVLQFGMMYSENEQYLHAVQQTLPLLQEVTDSLRRNQEQATTAVPTKLSVRVETKAPSNSLSKKNIRNTDISVEGSENAVPLANPKKAASNVSKTESSKVAASSFVTNKRNSPRQLPVVNASSTSEAKMSEASLPSSSRSIPSVLPPTTATKKKEAPKQCELVEIPSFEEVKPALIKGGYKFTAKSFFRPPISGKDSIAPQRFASIAALRRDLCIYGVNCQCGQRDEAAACTCWTADEKWYIKLWVRYDVMRGGVKNPGPVPILAPHVAQQYLIRLGYYSRQLSSSLLTTDQVHDLFRYLSRFGLPMKNSGNEDATCDYTQLTPLERLSLEYFISSSHYCVNTL
jgi:hypothetical protein